MSERETGGAPGGAIPVSLPDTHPPGIGSRGRGGSWAGGRALPRRIAVVLLLGCHLGLATSAQWDDTQTFDEPVYLAGGVSYWQTGDFRLLTEGSILPQIWASLPLAILGIRFPTDRPPGWETSDAWPASDQLIYGSGHDRRLLFRLGRLMVTLLALGASLLVYGWSAALFGPRGGLISLSLFAFSPTVLAHGRLMTADMAAATFFLLALGSLWYELHRPGVRSFLGATLALALIFLSKHSAVLLIPVGLWLMVVRVGAAGPITAHERLRMLVRYLGVMLAHAVLVWALVWAAFSFRYPVAPPDREPPRQLFWGGWEFVSTVPGPVQHAIGWLRDGRWLPEGYLYSIAYFHRMSQQRAAFMDGEIRIDGWRTFFLRCLAYKTTPSLFVLLLLAIGGLARSRSANDPPGNAGRGRLLYHLVPLISFLLAYLAIASLGRLNIGHRHVLPLYPILFILAGASAILTREPVPPARGSGARLATVAVLGALLAHGTGSLAIWPHHLAYFNALAGGPRSGYRHLVDSSLDWGQDLDRLARWISEERPSDLAHLPIHLSYFGSARPGEHGFSFRPLPSFLERHAAGEPVPLEPGLYAISATMLQGVYLPTAGRFTGADLENLHKLEEFWSRQEGLRGRIGAGSAEPAPALAPESASPAVRFLARSFDLLRFARLTLHLRTREPDWTVGHSILIYRVGAGELSRALE